MEVYIQGIGSISPQGTHHREAFLEEPRVYRDLLLSCEEPDFKEYIPAREARRMSRVVKMGLSAARMSLDRVGVESPEAIVTGTGLGCMEETENFLLSMIEENEQLLNPSPFIRSTHNSIGGQLAISLGCQGYNHTYVHRGLSFASSMMDGKLLLEEGSTSNVLVGGFEETTENHFKILSKIGYWKPQPLRNLELLKDLSPGTIAGEGAQFFFLSGERKADSLAKLEDVDLFYDPSDEHELLRWVEAFLKRNGLGSEGPDAVLYGYSGDPESDRYYGRVREALFPNAIPLYYKHLSGEYYTADSFGLWVAMRILQEGKVPGILRMEDGEVGCPRSVLLYDHFFGKDHTLYLLSG